MAALRSGRLENMRLMFAAARGLQELEDEDNNDDDDEKMMTGIWN